MCLPYQIWWKVYQVHRVPLNLSFPQTNIYTFEDSVDSYETEPSYEWQGIGCTLGAVTASWERRNIGLAYILSLGIYVHLFVVVFLLLFFFFFFFCLFVCFLLFFFFFFFFFVLLLFCQIYVLMA